MCLAIAATVWLMPGAETAHKRRNLCGVVRWRIEFQEGCGGVAGASGDLARARPLRHAKQQAYLQITPEQPGKMLGHLGRITADESGRPSPGHHLSQSSTAGLYAQGVQRAGNLRRA